jgi:hypothetical protein
MNLECLSGLVGLSNRDCPCLSSDAPSGYNESSTGYFLTDTEYGFPLVDAVFANLDCGEASVWQALAQAREDAIRDFQSDLQKTLLARRDQKLPAWKGLIGKTDGNFYAPERPMTGVQLRPRKRMRDAALVITAVHYAIETAGAYPLTIAGNDYTFAPVSETINATGGSAWARHELATPVRLPFYSLSEESLRYSITLDTTGTRVRYNRFWCCQRPGWMQELDFGGIIADAANNEANACGTVAGGLCVEGYLDCDKIAWLCDLSELGGLDFLDLVARCIQFKGASKMIARVLESGRVNYWTVLAPESLAAKRKQLQDMYAEYVEWIVREMPGNISGCWGCAKNAPRAMTMIS